eukprot:COSAG05_NODE_180_length_14817_cov_423.925262_9_plen_236_part_00
MLAILQIIYIYNIMCVYVCRWCRYTLPWREMTDEQQARARLLGYTCAEQWDAATAAAARATPQTAAELTSGTSPLPSERSSGQITNSAQTALALASGSSASAGTGGSCVKSVGNGGALESRKAESAVDIAERLTAERHVDVETLADAVAHAIAGIRTTVKPPKNTRARNAWVLMFAVLSVCVLGSLDAGSSGLLDPGAAETVGAIADQFVQDARAATGEKFTYKHLLAQCMNGTI